MGRHCTAPAAAPGDDHHRATGEMVTAPVPWHPVRVNERSTAAAVALAVLASVAGAAPPPGIHVPDDVAAPVLDRVGPLDGATAFAVAPDGRLAAAAFAPAASGRDSELRLYSLDREDAESIVVPGQIRDLLFLPDGETLYAIEHKPAPKREGETHLLRIGVADLDARREMRLPPSARALEYWPERGALLVAAQDELRVLLLPGPRTGPQYRIPGDNLAVGSAGGSLVLVGQADRLSLYDLDDPPGRDALPVRATVDTPAPVVAFAVASDGSRGIARSADGRLAGIEFDPLALRFLEGVEPVVALVRTRPAASVRAAIGEPAAVPAERPAAPSDAAPPPNAVERKTPEAAAPRSERRSPPAPVAPPPSGASVRPEPALDRAEPPQPPTPGATEGGVRGAIGGPAAHLVESVVLFGPNHVLREAARVRPGDDGTWSAGGLAPGRYRVLPQAHQATLEADPPFQTIEVRAGVTAELPLFRIVGTH
jgi:hypothetical protein